MNNKSKTDLLKKENSESYINLKTTTSLFNKNDIVNIKHFRKSIFQLKKDINHSLNFFNKYEHEANIKNMKNSNNHINDQFENNYIDKNELRLKNRILFNKKVSKNVNKNKREQLGLGDIENTSKDKYKDKNESLKENHIYKDQSCMINLDNDISLDSNYNLDNRINFDDRANLDNFCFDETELLKTSTNVKRMINKEKCKSHNFNYNNEDTNPLRKDQMIMKINNNTNINNNSNSFSNQQINLKNKIHKLNLSQYKLALKANLNEKDFIFNENHNLNQLEQKAINLNKFNRRHNNYQHFSSADFNCLKSIKSEFIKTDIEFDKNTLYLKHSNNNFSKNLDFSSYTNLGKTNKLKDLKKTIKVCKPSNIYEIENQNKIIKPHELELKKMTIKKSKDDIDNAIIKSIFNKPTIFRDKNSKIYRLDFYDYQKLLDDDVLKKSELVDLKVLNTQKKAMFVKNVIDNIYPKVMKMRTNNIKSSF